MIKCSIKVFQELMMLLPNLNIFLGYGKSNLLLYWKPQQIVKTEIRCNKMTTLRPDFFY